MRHVGWDMNESLVSRGDEMKDEILVWGVRVEKQCLDI